MGFSWAGVYNVAFPVTGILDSFDRADEGPPMTGWTTGLRGGTNGLKIVTNQCQGAVAAAANDGYWNAQQYGPDCEVYCTLVTLPTSGDELELWARVQNPGTSVVGYLVRFIRNTPGNLTRIQIYRSDNNVQTQLGVEVGTAPVMAPGDKFGLQIVGGALNVYMNRGAGWVLQRSETDTTYQGSGYLGLRFFNSSTATVDDFGGGGLSGESDETIVVPYARGSGPVGPF
jgi:hypothetical protein